MWEVKEITLQGDKYWQVGWYDSNKVWHARQPNFSTLDAAEGMARWENRNMIGARVCECGHPSRAHHFPVPPYKIHQVGAPCDDCDCTEFKEKE